MSVNNAQEYRNSLVSFATLASCHHKPPVECLFVKVRASRTHLGEATCAQVDFLEEQGLFSFRKWVDHS